MSKWRQYSDCEPVGGGERLLRLEHELREVALLVDLDHAHAEVRRRLVQRIQVDERLVAGGGVLEAELLEVELAEVAVDAVLVALVAVRGEVLPTDAGPPRLENERLITRNVSAIRRSVSSSFFWSKSYPVETL